MGRRLSWVAALGLASAAATATATPLEITQEALGADQVRISVIVGSIGELSDWLGTRDGTFDPGMLDFAVETGGLTFGYGGGYVMSPPVVSGFAASMGVDSLALNPDAANRTIGAEFSYVNTAPLAAGTVLLSFVTARPALEAGSIELASLRLTPLFPLLDTSDDDNPLPSWASTLVAAAVPEPSSSLLMLVGLGAFMLRRRTAA